MLKIQWVITGCRTGRWLDCYCSEAAWSLWSPELSWRPLYFASPVIGAAGLSKYMLFLSFSTPSACCLSLPPHSHTSVLVSLLLVSFPIPLILSMTVSPPTIFPCVSLLIYWLIDAAIPCKLLYLLSANKGRKTCVSDPRTRSSHASLGSSLIFKSRILIIQQHLCAPVAVFSHEQKVSKEGSPVSECVALQPPYVSGLVSQYALFT